MRNFSFILFLSIFSGCMSQHVFSKKVSYCTFRNDQLPKNQRVIDIENTFWNIGGEARDKDTRVKLSMCKRLPESTDCDPNAAICVSNEKKSTKNIRNAGSHFEYVIDGEEGVLRSVNGQKCDEHENFTVIIQFDSGPEAQAKPKLVFMDECELRLKIISPQSTPLCTAREYGNFIDLRPLKKLQNVFLNEPKLNKNYSLSFCKKSTMCQDGISVCEIIENEMIPISRIEYTRVSYDERHGLILKSRYGESKKIRRSFELRLICNWNVKDITDLMAFPSPGKTVKFKAVSSLGCIKFPTNCLIRDNIMPNFLYDLNELNKNYEVRNIPGGKIIINICNILTMPQGINDCTKQYSQVCYQRNGNVYNNLGSIPKNFHVTTENTVKGSFTDGSVCALNETLTYSTEVEFICKFTNQRPVLEAIDGCTYKIKWYTRAACPKNVPQNDNCVVQDATGTVNLRPLHQTTDRQITLSPNSILRYNFCGALTTSCGNNTDASVCYIDEKEMRVVGFVNNRLRIDGNVLILDMPGQQFRNTLCNTKVKFYCNEEIQKEELIRANIIKDKCVYEISVETGLACGASSTSNCTFVNDNLLYDLSKISRNNSNYLVTNKDKVYMLNVCRSIVKTEDALCPPFSAICMKNTSEPDLRNRYKSLGHLNANVAPRFENNDLIITYKQGSYCFESESLYRTSSIRFQCSMAEEDPKLIHEHPCHQEFLWRTLAACPTKLIKSRSTTNSCIYSNTYNNKSIDLASVKYSVQFETTNNYFKLDLCSNTYVVCETDNFSNTNCVTRNATVKIVSNSTDLYLRYSLNRDCDPLKKPNAVYINLICADDNDGHYEIENFTDCLFKINLKTKVVCDQQIPAPIVEKEKLEIVSTDRSKLPTDLTYQILQSKSQTEEIVQSCENGDMQTFNFSVLNNTKITSINGSVYHLNFQHVESFCSGLICKDGINVVPYESTVCPIIEYNYAKSFATVRYKSNVKCRSADAYNIQIRFTCKLKLDIPTALMESECHVLILNPIPEMCPVFDKKVVTAQSSVMVIGTCVGLLLIVLIIGGLLFYRKRYTAYATLTKNKRCVRIYLKDATD